MKNFNKLSLAGGVAMAFAFISPSTQADTLIGFNFENFSVGQISGSASFAADGLSATHNMANNGVENFGPPNNKLSMTRFAGSLNYPQLTFSTLIPIKLNTVEFLHISNHNPGLPTYPTYNVDLEIDTGSGFDVLSTFVAQNGGYFSESVPTIPDVIMPGTYKLRWIPQVSPNTSTEFFGLDNIQLVGVKLGCNPCATWKNHGAYVSCVSHAINAAVANGDVTQDQVIGLVASAAQSSIGKTGFVPEQCPTQP
ncbi:MAG: hypothetical protein WC856_28390 [Methylococcaceae bacterium]|jgi:hypothetical protein